MTSEYVRLVRAKRLKMARDWIRATFTVAYGRCGAQLVDEATDDDIREHAVAIGILGFGGDTGKDTT